MLMRLLGAVTGGTLVAAALIYLMQSLIIDDQPDRISAYTPEVMRVAVVPREPTPMQSRPLQSSAQREQPFPDELTETPVMPIMPPSPEIQQPESAPQSLLRAGIQEQSKKPLVQIDPVYPEEALERQLEGSVVLEYTVSESGSVRDIVIVDSTDALFTSAARKAVAQFVYAPEFIDGARVAVPGVRMRIDFVLVE